MTFLQPTMLWFLFLAAIPVILYILFRRRRNEVAWAATYILRLALASGRKRSLWQQIVIVCLRTLLLAALVLAFARPFEARRPEEDGGRLPHGPGTLHRVVLFDNSLSMRARHGVGSRLDAAREALAEILSTTRSGDRVHLVPLCPPKAGAAVEARALPAPVSAEEAWRLAAEIEPVSTRMEFAPALRAAVETFRNHAAATRQLILVTDLARVDHDAVSDYDVFGAMLEDLGVRTATLDLGSPDALNIAIRRITAGTEMLLARQPTNVYVEVANASDAPGTQRRLQFYVDGERKGEQPCELPAGHHRTFTFPVVLAAGPHDLEARLEEDAYEADNRVHHFIRAEEALHVLAVVPDKEAGEGFEKEAAFLERALRAQPKDLFEMDLQILKAGMVTPDAFEKRHAVLVCGGAVPPAGVREPLARFVRQGGGLLLALGPATDADAVRAAYGDLLPARLEKPFRASFDEERYLTVQTGEIALPLLREFRQAENGDLSRARIYNHIRLAVPPETGAETDARTILRLGNGDPLLVGHAFGKGRALLWATTLGGAWSSLPVRQAYLPFLYRLLNYASGFAATPRNVNPGAPLILEVPEGVSKVFLTTPDARLEECTLIASHGRRFVRMEETAAPGVYELQDEDGEKLASFSVAMPLRESDLRALEKKERTRFGAGLRTAFATDLPALRAALWREGDGAEQAGWLLLLALGLLLLDALLTRIWFG